jgi:molybdopterin-guanine dinucleotide biosynthesis protein A
MKSFDAIVLAGGSSARMRGKDKALLTVAGRSLLRWALEAVRDAQRIVVVGPVRANIEDVIWVHEDPPGGGPVAGLAAGLDRIEEELVVILPVDMPLVDRALVDALLATVARSVDGAALVDGEGRSQPLAAAYRAGSLRRALTGLGPPSGRSVRELVGDLLIEQVAAGGRAIDCDSPEDLLEAERLVVH